MQSSSSRRDGLYKSLIFLIPGYNSPAPTTSWAPVPIECSSRVALDGSWKRLGRGYWRLAWLRLRSGPSRCPAKIKDQILCTHLWVAKGNWPQEATLLHCLWLLEWACWSVPFLLREVTDQKRWRNGELLWWMPKNTSLKFSTLISTKRGLCMWNIIEGRLFNKDKRERDLCETGWMFI